MIVVGFDPLCSYFLQSLFLNTTPTLAHFSSPCSESASIYVCKHLLDEGAQLCIYDPKVKEDQVFEDLHYAMPEAKERVDKLAKVVADPYTAAKDAHAVVILTEWDEFKELDYARIFASMLKPAFLFDGRLILDHQKLKGLGFRVEAIGKTV